MSATPKKRRPKGSIETVLRGLYAMFQRHCEFAADPTSDHDTIVKSSNVGVQLALAIARLTELHEVERDLQALERLTPSNGHLA